jgi:serine/threonine protein kinase
MLVKISARSGSLPPSLFVKGVQMGLSPDCVYEGGFADVYRGNHIGVPVAVKRLRRSDEAESHRVQLNIARLKERLLISSPQRLCREALIWRQLQHPYILPFIGIDDNSFSTSGHVSIITPWMKRGTLHRFMRSQEFTVKAPFYINCLVCHVIRFECFEPS